ncbi:MAG TPA: Mu P family protein [Mesorhizobium sp.]|jgi:prophage tail gpP-like protein|uniref:phage baseplate assembly protein n=1 Tax=Mesorhizobium sp. TaxID=1871066 RepID=UPI002DDD6643|nr:Mu P family protein [Mesorhizobium sp.]HEV2501600.1 Mu P family protein [Mesorhizobium sp.]
MSLVLEIDGVSYEEWTKAEVTRNLKDFSGSFSFTLRDGTRSVATFDYASPRPIFRLRPGPEVKCYADGVLVLHGYIKTVEPDINEDYAEVTISGEDKAGDLIDCAAAPDGPGEFKNVKLEDAVKRIAEPFGLKVRSEIDTGKPFPRYALDLGETGHSAIEKGARQRHALVMSDGVGGVVITRTGAKRAPADLALPGNAKGSRGKFTHKGRHSKTIVRGQGEKASGERDTRAAALTPGTAPADPADRQPTDGSAYERERRGTATTGRATDPEIERYRPIVHLARTQADEQSTTDEADWRMRTARANSEETNYRVHGYSVGGRVWRVNEMTYVSDAFQGIERDMLISTVTFRKDEGGEETELTVTSPEAYDKKAAGSRRKNLQSKKSAGTGKLDGTAEKL